LVLAALVRTVEVVTAAVVAPARSLVLQQTVVGLAVGGTGLV
jgi:hypothetical protein